MREDQIRFEAEVGPAGEMYVQRDVLRFVRPYCGQVRHVEVVVAFWRTVAYHGVLVDRFLLTSDHVLLIQI